MNSEIRTTKKIIATAICILLTVIFACGCSSEAKEKKIAEKTLHEKYGAEFQCDIVRDYDSKSFYAWCRSGDARFKALVGKKKSYGCLDNYVPAKIAAHMAEDVSVKLKSMGYDYYVIAENSMEFITEDNTEMSVREYLEKHPGDRFGIYIMVPEDDVEEFRRDGLLDAVRTHVAQTFSEKYCYVSAFWGNEEQIEQIRFGIEDEYRKTDSFDLELQDVFWYNEIK